MGLWRSMTTIVVGGHARNVGKTAVASGLIAAFRRYPWTAIKISSHRHAGVAAASSGEFYEERDREGRSDTSRFLIAGASRALWVQIGEDDWRSAMQKILPILQSSPFVLIESNRVLQFMDPDLYILVLKYDIVEFKQSARETLSRADAIVAVDTEASTPTWQGVPIEALKAIPLFTTTNPLKIPGGLIDFVRSRLLINGSS
jgi:hypothetical protein